MMFSDSTSCFTAHMKMPRGVLLCDPAFVLSACSQARGERVCVALRLRLSVHRMLRSRYHVCTVLGYPGSAVSSFAAARRHPSGEDGSRTSRPQPSPTSYAWLSLQASDCTDENSTGIESAEAAGIEIFPLNTSVNPKEANPWLFVRKQQREVWQAAFNAPQDVVVTGSPGIGKSCSMPFLFRDLMRANKTFVFEARRWNMVYLFKPRTDGTYEVGSMTRKDWKMAACEELKARANYYVIDPAEAEKGGVCFVKAKTVICLEPDPQHLGEFKKIINLRYLYMAACSLRRPAA